MLKWNFSLRPQNIYTKYNNGAEKALWFCLYPICHHDGRAIYKYWTKFKAIPVEYSTYFMFFSRHCLILYENQTRVLMSRCVGTVRVLDTSKVKYSYKEAFQTFLWVAALGSHYVNTLESTIYLIRIYLNNVRSVIKVLTVKLNRNVQQICRQTTDTSWQWRW